MTKSNYRIRIPSNSEYLHLMDAEEDDTAHWKDMFSWTTDYVDYSVRSILGYASSHYRESYDVTCRSASVGFRPVFEPINGMPTTIPDGEIITVGTLYMDDEPIKVPCNPTWNGDVANYIPGAKLELRPALDDPAYQVRAIKYGNVFICDRCLLKNISYNDIVVNLQDGSALNSKSKKFLGEEFLNYKIRMPSNEEYDCMINAVGEDNARTHWSNMLSWVNDSEFVAEQPDRRACRGYTSARNYRYRSAGYRTVHVGFRPAFEPLGNDTLPADIADGDVVVVGTLYMNGEPIRTPQNPVWNGDIANYIPDAVLEFKPALWDPAYQIQAIKCGNLLICDRCLLKDINYDDINANLTESPMPIADKKTFNYKVHVPVNKEYVRLMDVTAEDDAVTHWDDMFSWVDDPEFVAEHPDYRAIRGYHSVRHYHYSSADTRIVHIGFRPAFEPLGNTDVADGDIITIGTLYMDNKPVKVPQSPQYYGDIEDYIPDAALEFKPALEDPAYQVNAIKVGKVFICDRCLLKYISYDDICASFPNNN